MTGARFQVRVIGGRRDGLVIETDTETAAICEALDHVGPGCTQVTVTGFGPRVDTFAVRHFSWQRSDGDSVHDSGWRAWVDGEHIGGVAHWPLVEVHA